MIFLLQLVARTSVTVPKKLQPPATLLTPLACSVKKVISVATPGAPLVERGGYRVQPVTEPPEARELYRSNSAQGRISNLRRLTRGRAISSATTNNGYSQLPNHPRSPGISPKKIIARAWKVKIPRYALANLDILELKPELEPKRTKREAKNPQPKPPRLNA